MIASVAGAVALFYTPDLPRRRTRLTGGVFPMISASIRIKRRFAQW
jgi:hypothetical protein